VGLSVAQAKAIEQQYGISEKMDTEWRRAKDGQPLGQIKFGG
jgi:hypothetical protein|tara:strand:+ start:325 stop:450 length:126 start_codon:yes stop_codon:yes gene_type:complete